MDLKKTENIHQSVREVTLNEDNVKSQSKVSLTKSLDNVLSIKNMSSSSKEIDGKHNSHINDNNEKTRKILDDEDSSDEELLYSDETSASEVISLSNFY